MTADSENLRLRLQPSPLRQLAAKLLQCDEQFPPDLLERMYTVAKNATRNLNVQAGEFLHNLSEKKHSQAHVQSIINVFPSSLSHKKDGRLPVQKAACYKVSLSFIPLLAYEGNRLNVGGDDSHGGLLNIVPIDPGNINVLQILAEGTFCVKDPKTVDKKYLQVMKSLQSMNLLRKEHIEKYDLLGWASYTTSRQRFKYLTAWNPEALRTSKHKGVPLLVDSILRPIHTKPQDCFEMILEAGMKYFSDEFGFIFRKYNGRAACERAILSFGKEDAMVRIRKYILPSDNHPILHQVAAHAPQYMNDFANYYPDATYIRDKNKRLLFHAELASGTKSFSSHSLFFLQATDGQIGEKDPVTGLYPFMIAASDSTSDLSAVYSLLVRQPRLAELENAIMLEKKASILVSIERQKAAIKSQQVQSSTAACNTAIECDEISLSDSVLLASSPLNPEKKKSVNVDVVKNKWQTKSIEGGGANMRRQRTARIADQPRTKMSSSVLQRVRGIEMSLSTSAEKQGKQPISNGIGHSSCGHVRTTIKKLW